MGLFPFLWGPSLIVMLVSHNGVVWQKHWMLGGVRVSGMGCGDELTQWLVSWILDQQVWNGVKLRSLCHVLGHGTLPLQCLSPPKSVNGTGQFVRTTWQLLGVTSDGLASHPRGEATLLDTSCYRNWSGAPVLMILLASLFPWEWNWLSCPVARENITGMYPFLATKTWRGIWCFVWNKPFTI